MNFIERRLNIQKVNNKCKYDSGYICGDITLESTKKLLFDEINKWKKSKEIEDVDVLIATPPCQGMSVANLKKNNEINRNSLVVESIKLIKEIKPNYFIFENVAAFLKTVCIDIDENVKSIEEAIEYNLKKDYVIMSKIINFKDYGSNSSRTRTIVIGVNRKLEEDISPIDLFPKRKQEKSLRNVIGNLKRFDENGKFTGEVENKEDATVLTSSGKKEKDGAEVDAGKIQISGLKEGTYTLIETKAPEGYNTPNFEFVFKITPRFNDDGILEDADFEYLPMSNSANGYVTGVQTKDGVAEFSIDILNA